VQRNLVGEIIKRFEQKGYRLVALKMITPTKDFAAEHYDDLKSKVCLSFCLFFIIRLRSNLFLLPYLSHSRSHSFLA
jgi:nucleoside diphosphate kinase